MNDIVFDDKGFEQAIKVKLGISRGITTDVIQYFRV